jgi:hypothetical protein
VGLVRPLDLLGGLCLKQGRLEEAWAFYKRSLDMVRHTHGLEHPDMPTR